MLYVLSSPISSPPSPTGPQSIPPPIPPPLYHIFFPSSILPPRQLSTFPHLSSSFFSHFLSIHDPRFLIHPSFHLPRFLNSHPLITVPLSLHPHSLHSTPFLLIYSPSSSPIIFPLILPFPFINSSLFSALILNRKGRAKEVQE